MQVSLAFLSEMFDFDENLLLLTLCAALSRMIEYFSSAAEPYLASYKAAGSPSSVSISKI
jgi:hypothetical protein